MTKVKVNKQDLLNKLYENKKIHENEFNELNKQYKEDVINGLTELLKEAKKLKDDPIICLNLLKPDSYISQYSEIIGMLEMSVDDEFEITQEEYKNYVLNIWSWTQRFDNIKSAYSRR